MGALSGCLGMGELQEYGALAGYGRAVWVWTRSLVMGGVQGYGRAVWVWACCRGRGVVSGYGRAVWVWAGCLGMGGLSGYGRAVSVSACSRKCEVERSYRDLQGPTGRV